MENLPLATQFQIQSTMVTLEKATKEEILEFVKSLLIQNAALKEFLKSELLRGLL